MNSSMLCAYLPAKSNYQEKEYLETIIFRAVNPICKLLFLLNNQSNRQNYTVFTEYRANLNLVKYGNKFKLLAVK